MIYSVKFHQKFHIIPMVRKLLSQKKFFYLQISTTTYLIPHISMVVPWNKLYEENEMIEVRQA